MNVKMILDEKGREVVTVERDTTLVRAIAVLAERRIGALVVSDGNGTIAGILSERDIVRALAEDGAGALDQPVSSRMTAEVMVCTEDHTVDRVMEMMTNGRFRHLPVEKGGRLAGLVSIGDVVRKRIEAVEREAEEMKAYIAS